MLSYLLMSRCDFGACGPTAHEWRRVKPALPVFRTADLALPLTTAFTNKLWLRGRSIILPAWAWVPSVDLALSRQNCFGMQRVCFTVSRHDILTASETLLCFSWSTISIPEKLHISLSPIYATIYIKIHLKYFIVFLNVFYFFLLETGKTRD